MKTALMLAASLLTCVAADAGLFGVLVETGTRTACTGDAVSYSLFIPQPADGLPPPPWPAVVLNHGFARTKKAHADNAFFMAQRGLVVLTPDQVGLGGAGVREKNIAVTLDHLEWLRARSDTPDDPLEGLVDWYRMGLAGHSAGGAMSFEAAARSQAEGFPLSAVFLLDAVPWRSTLEAAPTLMPLALGSLRSEPAPCNAQGAVRELLQAISFPVDDLLLVGATHCDPENPTDALCRWFCGGSTAIKRSLYRRLMVLFFQDAFDMPPVELVFVDYGATLEWLEGQGLIAREALPGAPFQ
jgi:pimeloyl-ACP methyl ester carboxylesterase